MIASDPARPSIAFIGLGVMGLPMARNLARAGFPIRAHDVSGEARDRPTDAGLTAVDTLPVLACSEGIIARVKLGLDRERLTEALLGGASASWALANLGPQMIADDSSAGFRIRLQLKDLRLALDAANRLDARLPAVSQVTDQYLEACAHGEGDNGNQVLYRVYERLAGSRRGSRSTGRSRAVRCGKFGDLEPQLHPVGNGTP